MATIKNYVDDWKGQYRNSLGAVPLLNPDKARDLSSGQRRYFAELFYHARGHFAPFLWVLGSKAPTLKAKQVILDNIADEFGAKDESHVSHEDLYVRFAQSLGADVHMEAVTYRSYAPFLRRYNDDHLRFLLAQDWDTCSAAFSAYELLDETDYTAIEEIGKSWGLEREDLEFFEVHRKGEHYKEVSGELSDIWKRDLGKVERAFDFIGDHQISMWHRLSESVFEY